MLELVIGRTGFIGSAMLRYLGPNAVGTSRRHGEFDMLSFKDVPPGDIVYICAGANGAKACEGNQDSFRVNVDAPAEIARIVTRRGDFVVFISTMSAEWLSTAYQRQKLAAETILRAMPGVGVVRAGRVLASNIDDLCATMARVGRNHIEGVTRWGNDDIAYDPRGASAPR